MAGMKMILRALAGAALAGAALGAISAPAATPTPFAAPAKGSRAVYRNVALIDGTGGPLRRGMAIVMDGDRITDVVADRDLPAAALAGADVVDLKGQYVVPGLIDTHVHIATPPDRVRAEAVLRRNLYGGVTAIRDMADDLRSVAEITRASRLGEIAAPDIYFAALMAGPSFFDDKRTWAVSKGVTPGAVPWMQAITDDTDMPLAVAMSRGTGATAIKAYANMPGRTVAAIVAEAHRQHFPVWAHGAIFPASPAEVIGAGVDVVSHVCYLAYQVSDSVPASYQQRVPVAYDRLAKGDNPVIGGLFRQMAQHGQILDATGRVYLEYDERAAANPAKPPLCTADLAARLIDQARRAGVEISTGTDGTNAADKPWPELHDELAFLVERAKMTPAQVIRSATLVGARAAGQEKDMGSIEAGKLGNFVVLARNPLENIRNIDSIVMTVKRGHAFPRTDFKPLTKDELGDEE
ncbi:amidohydrolase family protein [Sphingomonas sp. MM-1]|uniref:amidohydrolase family protein n=1 Tax=Sphingomonas sp. MM-1 TaxID=745310 RepID=UPI001F237122|nr:amidohydrolase family protein [Sphingomonas sp. MM-1]